jgi:hypothetical protein
MEEERRAEQERRDEIIRQIKALESVPMSRFKVALWRSVDWFDLPRWSISQRPLESDCSPRCRMWSCKKGWPTFESVRSSSLHAHHVAQALEAEEEERKRKEINQGKVLRDEMLQDKITLIATSLLPHCSSMRSEVMQCGRKTRK